MGDAETDMDLELLGIVNKHPVMRKFALEEGEASSNSGGVAGGGGGGLQYSSQTPASVPLFGNCHPGYFCGVFAGLVWAVLNGILSVYNITYANEYEGQVMCWNATARAGTSYDTGLSSTVGVTHWMRVYGWQVTMEAVAFAIVVIFAMLRFCARGGSCQEPCCIPMGTNICLCVCMIFCVLFRFAWNIVGAVLIWRDCPDFSPQPVKDLCWATVIICYFGLGLTSVSAAIGINLSVAASKSQ